MAAEADVPRALVVRAGALGDLVLLRRAVASLRRAGASVTLVAPTGPGSAIVNSEDHALARKLVPWESAELARALATESDRGLRALLGTFDHVVCYSRDADLGRRLARIAGRLVVHDPAPVASHASAWLMEPVAALGIASVDPPVVTPTSEEARAAAVLRERLPAGFLALHPGSGSPRKNWPADRYAELARRVSAGRPWLLSLGPADAAAESLAREPNVVVTRDLPPRELGALLASAGVYVGNDSGVSHVAAAWGVPTVALFGPTDSGVWSPVGPRVRTLRAADDRMESISIDEAEQAVVSALAR